MTAPPAVIFSYLVFQLHYKSINATNWSKNTLNREQATASLVLWLSTQPNIPQCRWKRWPGEPTSWQQCLFRRSALKHLFHFRRICRLNYSEGDTPKTTSSPLICAQCPQNYCVCNKQYQVLESSAWCHFLAIIHLLMIVISQFWLASLFHFENFEI